MNAGLLSSFTGGYSKISFEIIHGITKLEITVFRGSGIYFRFSGNFAPNQPSSHNI